MEISEEQLSALDYTKLRVLAMQLGVLVQDDPSLDVLRQRIRQCQMV